MGSYYASNSKSVERGVLDLFDTTNIDLDNKQVAVGGLFGYVSGDVIGGVKQIVKAASDGCCAAYKIKEYLKGN